MLNFSFFNKTQYSFEGKKEGEEVIIFLHRHWFTLVSTVVYLLCAALLPFIVAVIGGHFILEYNLAAIFGFLWAAYYLGLWYVLFYTLTMYALDSWAVTNMRIIDSRQHGFFNRTVAELVFANIQDVSFNVEGAIPTMLNYGDVQVQTAGSEKHFHFIQIPNPQHVKDEIMQITAEFKAKQQQENHPGI